MVLLSWGLMLNTIFFGNKLMSVYNKKGIFSNYSDSADALEKVLSCFFLRCIYSYSRSCRVIYREK